MKKNIQRKLGLAPDMKSNLMSQNKYREVVR